MAAKKTKRPVAKKRAAARKKPAAMKKLAASRKPATRPAPAASAPGTAPYSEGKWAAALAPRSPAEKRYWLVKSEPETFSFDDLLHAPVQPYTRERFDDTYNWTVKWNMTVPGATYENTVDNRAWQ